MSDAWNQRAAELLASYPEHPILQRIFVQLVNRWDGRARFDRINYRRQEPRPSPDDFMHQALLEYQEWARQEARRRDDQRRIKANNDRFNALTTREEQDAYMNAKMIEERKMREQKR
jgi:hypothetical protein